MILRARSAILSLAPLALLVGCSGDCAPSLTVVNTSGRVIASGSILPPGGPEAAALGSLSVRDAREFRFAEIGEGAYAVEIRFADGTVLREPALGYVTRHTAFRDTLFVLPPGQGRALNLKQAVGTCREGPRAKTLLREILKKAFR